MFPGYRPTATGHRKRAAQSAMLLERGQNAGCPTAGRVAYSQGMPFMLELFKTATTIRPKPMVPVSPSRLGPVAKSLGNAARYYQKVYRMTPLANQDSGIPVLFNEADHSFVQLHQDACPALFEEIANPMTFSKENVPIPAVFAPRDCRLLIEHQNFVTALNPLTICSPVPVLAKINGELRLVTGYDRDAGFTPRRGSDSFVAGRGC